MLFQTLPLQSWYYMYNSTYTPYTIANNTTYNYYAIN